MVNFEKIKLTKGIYNGTEKIELEIPDIKWVLWDGVPRGGKRINHVNYWSILKASDDEEARYIKDKLKNIRAYHMYSYELIKNKIWIFELNDVEKTYDMQMTTSHDLYDTYLKDLVFVQHTKYYRISSVFRIKEIDHPDSVTLQTVSLNSMYCFNRSYYNITTTINNCLPNVINVFSMNSDIQVEVFQGDIAKKWWYSAFNKAVFSYNFDLNFNEGDDIIWDAEIPNTFDMADFLGSCIAKIDTDSEEEVLDNSDILNSIVSEDNLDKIKEIKEKIKETEDILEKILKFNEQFKQ